MRTHISSLKTTADNLFIDVKPGVNSFIDIINYAVKKATGHKIV